MRVSVTEQGTAETDVAEITSEDELRAALGGFPSGRAATKDRPALHPLQIEWLRRSPFCVLSTSDADGNCDASPKGDPAGQLIHVLDPRTIAIAERPGNKRADGYLNILSNPHVGLVALYFSDLVVRGQRPVLAVVIEIETVFSHCPKAFLRSSLWEPSSWPAADALPSVAALSKAVQDSSETLEELEAHYAVSNYSRLLY